MKDSLKHLPENKQKELAETCELILEKTPVNKIILFGSYARGDWVSDRYKEGHVTYEYESDFDLLVIVDSEKLENNKVLWQEINDEIKDSENIKSPISLLVDTLAFVNKKLEEGNYFYLDIISEGVILYDSNRGTLITPKLMAPEKRRDLAESDFTFWMDKAKSFIHDYEHNMDDSSLSNAAFHLSQSVEALYFAILLVYTGYKPKTHKLDKIEGHISEILPDFDGFLPRESSEDIELFDLLNKAYIDARYKQDYEINKKDLEKLFAWVQSLTDKVYKVCNTRINSF